MLPIELHLPIKKGEYVPDGSFNNINRYSYAGPGTRVIQRLKEGYKGCNSLDAAALQHDMAYHLYKDRERRTVSDRILAERALKIAQDPNKSSSEKMMAVFIYKVFTENGIADKLQGKGMTLREKKPINYDETKPIGNTKQIKKPRKVIKKVVQDQGKEIGEEISKIRFPILAEELHHQIKKRFPRRRVIIKKINETFGMDLVFMNDVVKDNDEYLYILTIIDCFSKFSWAIGLKNKQSKTVFDAFISVINKSKRKPTNIWVDRGSEFYNKLFSTWLTKNSVNMYSTYENFHNPIIERFNRTLKEKMWRRFTLENTRNWVGMLDSLVDEYNNKTHRSIGMTPLQASDPKNQEKVYKNLYPNPEPELKTPKYKVGDIVRISRIKEIFEKGFHPNFSEELFKIVKINDTYPRTYKIQALDGEEVIGSFYEPELLKSKITESNLYDNSIHRVEKILERKKIKGVNMVKIKWAGYDHPTWEKAENVID